jgi:hypothetical protein
MASVNIYPEHKDILDGLITSGKVRSQVGAAETGPFKDQRDAYVFAAAIGIALGGAEPVPKRTSKGGVSIRDSVFLGAVGAPELSHTALLLEGAVAGEADRASLNKVLGQLSDTDWSERFIILDRYAFWGFSWLDQNFEEPGSIRDLVLEAIDKFGASESPQPEGILLERYLMA